MSAIIDALNQAPLAGLMLTIALGFLLGRVKLLGVTAGPAAGTLFTALALGQLGLSFDHLYGGLEPPLTVGRLGFALFIYAVGFEAGPTFFSCLRRDGQGWRFALVALSVNGVAVALALLLGRLLGLDAASTAGMLAGALTSAPTYAAASEVLTDPTALSLSFAITYPFGLIGLVVLLQLLPRLMHESLSAGLATEDEGVVGERRSARAAHDRGPEMQRTFCVESLEVVERPLAELDLIRTTGCVITRIRRADALLFPTATTVLAVGDQLLVTGRLDELERFQVRVGPEVYVRALIEDLPPARRIRVESRDATGKTLVALELGRRHRCVVEKIERHGELIEPMPDVCLERGDIVDVAGERDDVRAVARLLGTFRPAFAQTNIAAYTGGIALGLLVGSVHLRPFGLDVTLGHAGGLLLIGLLIGRYRRIGPFDLSVPREARQLVRDLGILLFVAEIGVRAGTSLVSGMSELFWRTFFGGAALTLVPVALSLIFARRILRMRPVDAWGSVCGAMTSSAALHAVKRAADSNEPAISYAAAYTIASVLVTVAGRFVVLMM